MKQSLRNPSRLARSVSFRLCEADYARLAYQAAVADLRINEFARRRVLQEQCSISITMLRQTDPALIQHLLSIGNNLNQLTKNAHIFGRVSPQVTTLCERIERIIDVAVDDDGGA